MNITELRVDDFGAWHNLTLDDLSKQATIFYGPNEAGKTTLLNMIRTVMYGFSEKRCSRYLPPARGKEAGGSLTVSDMNGRYSLHRSAPATYRGGDGVLRVTSERGGRHGAELLTTLLAGVDETIFNNVFAVGLTQMQHLATLSDTEAANQLYGLATGVDRVSLADVSRELETQRELLLPGLVNAAGSGSAKAVNSNGEVARLFEQKERLQRELKALRRDEGHYAKLRQEYRTLRKKIAEQEKARKLVDSGGDWSEISAEIRKLWARCKQANNRLEHIGPLVDVPKHVLSRVAGINTNIKQRRHEWEKLRSERRRLKAKARKQTGNHTLYRYAAEIEAIDRQRPRIASLDGDVKRLQTSVEELEFELQSEMEELGLQTGTSAKRLPEISDEIIDALRIPARETRELRDSVEALKKLAAERKKQAERVKGQLETAAVRFGGEDIDSVLQRSMRLAQSLERRIDLDDEREGIVRRLDEVQDEAKYWQGRSILPWNGIMTVCAVFSGGAALLLAGLFSNWFLLADATRLPMMLIGGSLAVVSLVIKSAFENSAQERASFFTQQLDLLQDEQDRAVEETAELDGVLKGKGHFDQRLIDAQSEIDELSKFLPLSQQHRNLLREAEAAEHQYSIAVKQLKDSRLAWKASLRAVGLPDSLTPTQIGSMTGRVSGVTQLRNRIKEARKDLEERKREHETISERVQQLLIEGEVTNVPESLVGQLSRLVTELGKHSRSGREREQYRSRWLELGEKQKRITTAAKQLYANRRQLLEAHGITSPADFRRTTLRGRKAAKMRKGRDRTLVRISEIAGGEFPVPKLQKMLDRRSNALLEQLSRIDRDRANLAEELKELHQRSGQLKQKLDGRMQDRRSEKTELAIRVLDEKIQQAGWRWRRSAMVTAVLDKVKQNYETKRQPVALAEASRHLERLTEGRYTRIWTPMGQSALCIDDANGRALPVEKLSRGTRELVFLALRLALVGSYSRRGANMPIVLDDVFVNFDDQRATAAAAVLYDIAKSGQQMLIFTCHERIREIFSRLGADVRDLPVRTGFAKRAEVPPEEPVPTQVEVQPEPVVTERVVETEVVVVDSELPVYDAEAWDEAVEELAIPLPAPPKQKKVTVPEEVDLVAAIPTSEENEIELPVPVLPKSELPVEQVEAAWRDEWLDPLPDLVDNDEAEDFFHDTL